ncbi:MAG TPA: tetratricopeptide repeat protein [Micromonosporaceae bacterium]
MLEYRVLGPVQVRTAGAPVYFGGPREQRTLVALLLSANQVVNVDHLTEVLWGEHLPRTAAAQIRNTIATLRRYLGPANGGTMPIVRRGGGFVIQVSNEQLDLLTFEQQQRLARTLAENGDLAAAATQFAVALELWQGPALAGLGAPVLDIEAHRLEEQRLACLERRIELDLALGRDQDVVAELSTLVHRYPLRERLAVLQMTALQQAGRRIEALDAFAAARARLIEHAGLDPGPELVQLQHKLLKGEESAESPEVDAGRASTVARPGLRDLRSDLPRPAQLPAEAAGFTGRDALLGKLDELLARTADTSGGPVRIATIVGTGGVGKTALVVHWGHRVRDRFPDGQLFVDLRGYAAAEPLQPITALSRFLRALGVPERVIPLDLDEAVTLYRSQLADRRMLLILDNARDAEQVRPLLPGSGTCLVLITSRDQLVGLAAREGATRVDVDALPLAEATRLLSALLEAQAVPASADELAELAQRCGRLPLALRVASASLISRRYRSASAYLDDIRVMDPLDALAVPQDSEATVRATFAHSYRPLVDPTATVFRLLGRVPGPELTPDAAAALAGCQLDQARQSLDQLCGVHLLQQTGPDRYSCHDLLRHYAQELSTAHDSAERRDAAMRRLLWHYLHHTDAAIRILHPARLRLEVPAPDDAAAVARFDDAGQASRWLDAELPNLVAAAIHACTAGPAQLGWLLADALRYYFHQRGLTVDWLTVAQRALVAAQQEGDLRAEAAIRLSLASLYWRLSRYVESVEHHEHALELARRCGWTRAEAAGLTGLATVYAERGDLDGAADLTEQALAMAQRIGDRPGVAIALGNLGLIRQRMGQLEQAAAHHEQALAAYRAIGLRPGEALMLGNLGSALARLGRHDEALAHLRQAIALHQELGDPGREAEVQRESAFLHSERGDLESARQAGHAALALARTSGRRRIEAETLSTLGRIHERAGEYVQAVRCHQEALAVATGSDELPAQIMALIGLGRAQHSLGQAEPAITYANQALALSQECGLQVHEGHALTTLAAAELASGAVPPASAHAEAALTVHRCTGHRRGEADTLVILAQLAARRDGPAAARPWWAAALDRYLELGLPEADTVRARLAPAEADAGRG